MPQYDFGSPGFAATQAIVKALAERQATQRQSMLDEILKKNVESEIESRKATTKRLDADAVSERAARDLAGQNTTATRQAAFSEIVPRGTELTPELEQALGPLAGMSEQTAGVMTGDNPNMQGPTMTKTYKGTAKQDANDEKLAMQAYIAQLTQQSKQQAFEIQKAVLENRMSHEQAQLALQQQNLDLRERLGNLDMEMKSQKVEKEKKASDTAALAIKNTRADSRALINEIMNNPALSNVVGPLAGRISSVMPESVALQAKITQLIDSLALDNRQKLQGQGAVSDFEGKMIKAASSALTQVTSPELFKKELQRLLGAFTGDTPREGLHGEQTNIGTLSTPGPVKTVLPTINFTPDGGR